MFKERNFVFNGLAAVLCLCCIFQSNTQAGDSENWKLGMQAYTFNRFTFYEAVDKTKSLGLHYIEAYPGQALSREKPDIKFDHNLSSGQKQEVLQKLR